MLPGLFGHAAEVDVQALQKELEPLLGDEEQLLRAFRTVRDLFVFTDKRLILVDKQGVTARKTIYHSIPYKSISHFAVETAGTFDLDAELKIYIASNPNPITYELKRGTDTRGLQKMLAQCVLK